MAALLFVSLVLSQTPVHTANQSNLATLAISFLENKLEELTRKSTVVRIVDKSDVLTCLVLNNVLYIL